MNAKVDFPEVEEEEKMNSPGRQEYIRLQGRIHPVMRPRFGRALGDRVRVEPKATRITENRSSTFAP
jgi:hypothetical protein